MNWIVAHAMDIIAIVTGVVTVASLITALTPSQDDDNWVAKVKRVVDFLALNVGHAKPPSP